MPAGGVSKAGLPAPGFRDRREIGAVAALLDLGFSGHRGKTPNVRHRNDESSLLLHAAKRRVVLEVSLVLGSNHTDDRSRQEEAALDGIPSRGAGSHRDATHRWHDLRIREPSSSGKQRGEQHGESTETKSRSSDHHGCRSRTEGASRRHRHHRARHRSSCLRPLPCAWPRTRPPARRLAAGGAGTAIELAREHCVMSCRLTHSSTAFEASSWKCPVCV
jgi:hypothetical protein